MGYKRPLFFILTSYAILSFLSVQQSLYDLFYHSIHSCVIGNCINYKNSQYQGELYRSASTVDVKPLVSNKRISVESHSMLSEDGQIISDWIFINEPNQINVLVHEQSSDKFILFRQQKYALPGINYAVLGGTIEGHEIDLDAAKRELKEELQLQSNEWIPLGKYRVNVNRGEGNVSLFFAKNSTPLSNERMIENQLAFDELEHQQKVRLTRNELTDLLLKGQIAEVKWSACVALALLHLNK